MTGFLFGCARGALFLAGLSLFWIELFSFKTVGIMLMVSAVFFFLERVNFTVKKKK